jgi:hypothetical protein
MPDPNILEQVIKFFLDLPDEEVRKVNDKFKAAAAERIDETTTREKAFFDRYQELVQDRLAKELLAVEQTAGQQKDIQQKYIDDLKKMWEKKNQDFLDMEKKNDDKILQAHQFRDKEELERYEKFLAERENISQRAQEARTVKEAPKLGKLTKIYEFGRRHDVAKGAGFKNLPPMDVSIWEQVGRAAKLLMEVGDKYMDLRHREEDILSARQGGLTGRLEDPTRGNMERSELQMRILELTQQFAGRYSGDQIKGFMLQMQQALPTETVNQTAQAIQTLGLESKQTGVTMEQLIELQASLVRDMGMTPDEALATVKRLHDVNERLQTLGVNVSQIELDKWALETAKELRFFGVSVSDASGLIFNFADALHRNILTIQQVNELVRAQAQAPEGAQAYVAQQFFRREAATNTRFQALSTLDPIEQLQTLRTLQRENITPGQAGSPEMEAIRSRLAPSGIKDSDLQDFQRLIRTEFPRVLESLIASTHVSGVTAGFLRERLGPQFGFSQAFSNQQRAAAEQGMATPIPTQAELTAATARPEDRFRKDLEERADTMMTYFRTTGQAMGAFVDQLGMGATAVGMFATSLIAGRRTSSDIATTPGAPAPMQPVWQRDPALATDVHYAALVQRFEQARDEGERKQREHDVRVYEYDKHKQQQAASSGGRQ